MPARAHTGSPRPHGAQTDPLAGTRYRSVGNIGSGGMGEVVLAEHLGLGKRVVVKLLHEELAKDPALVKRMQIEARSLAALASPYIVQVTDFGQTATGRTYIVMERLVGRTLGAELSARGALPAAEAIGYVVQVLAGLEAAHAAGIVHRDIKPENVFLCDATKDAPRTVKILDFGVAKVLDVDAEVHRPALPRLVTEEGGIVGTPRVVAPEQALGKPVDARTDVYAAGLLLYTAIAGRGPFAHLTDATELLKANVMSRPEPLSAKAPIPAALDAAVQRALEKLPAARFPSAEAFEVELRRIAAGLAGPPEGTKTTTGLLPYATPLPARYAGSDDRTLQLAAPHSPSVPEGELGQEPKPREANVEAASLPASRRGRARWGAFVVLMVLGAAISAVLLLALSRVMP
jgi:eukaryotic-like serine/threonine-protein kinase